MNFPVRGAAFQQLFMGAVADHPAFLQHNDLVQRPDGGNPLGDNDGGGVAVVIPNGLAQPGVGAVIQGGGAVVQHQNFRVGGRKNWPRE